MRLAPLCLAERGAVAAFCVLATFLFVLSPSTARAFCREVSEDPPAGYDPALQGCFAPTETPDGSPVYDAYWSNLCVGYSLQKDASRQVTLDEATQVAAQAFGAWTSAACPGGGTPSITAVDEGPVDCAMVQYNKNAPNQHVIVFRDDVWPYDDSSNTLGLTTLTVDLTTGEIYDADMEINSADYTLTVGGASADDAGADSGEGGATSYDLLSIMTHEAGHFLGMAHAIDTSAVMYAHYHPGSTVPDADDVAGICAIDQPNGQHATTTTTLPAVACDPTPRHGFSTECAGDAGTDDGGGSDPPSGTSSGSSGGCSVSPEGETQMHSGASLAALGAAIGALALLRLRRRRRARRRWPSPMVLAGGFLALAVAALLGVERPARASVSVAMLLDDLVEQSSAVAVGTSLEQRADWENGRIYTYTRLRVDALVEGALPQEIVVRTLGGAVGTIAQIVDGEARFPVGTKSLLFLHQKTDPQTGAPLELYSVVGRAQGQYPIVGDATGGAREHLVRATDAGMLMAPPADRVARAAKRLPVGEQPMVARDVLHQVSVQDAVKLVAGAWARIHP